MKNSDRLYLAWGYWFQCNGGLLGMVIFSLILTSGSVALALFPLLFGAIIFTNKMLDWRDGEEEASGRMLETLPLSNRLRSGDEYAPSGIDRCLGVDRRCFLGDVWLDCPALGERKTSAQYLENRDDLQCAYFNRCHRCAGNQ